MPADRRAICRRSVTLRVDLTTAQGQLELGIVRNLSLQGMSIEHVSRHVGQDVTPGDLLTVALVLPSGRPCTLSAVVVHGTRAGCGVQFRQGSPHAFTPLWRYWAALDEQAYWHSQSHTDRLPQCGAESLIMRPPRERHETGGPAPHTQGPCVSLRREQVGLEVFLDRGRGQGEHLRLFCCHVVFHRQYQCLKRGVELGGAGGQAPQVLDEGEGLLMLLETGVHQALPEARRFLFHRLGKDHCFALGVHVERVKDVQGKLPLHSRRLGGPIRPEELPHLLMIRVQHRNGICRATPCGVPRCHSLLLPLLYV
jgi:hypothetical protein